MLLAYIVVYAIFVKQSLLFYFLSKWAEGYGPLLHLATPCFTHRMWFPGAQWQLLLLSTEKVFSHRPVIPVAHQILYFVLDTKNTQRGWRDKARWQNTLSSDHTSLEETLIWTTIHTTKISPQEMRKLGKRINNNIKNIFEDSRKSSFKSLCYLFSQVASCM